MAKKAKIKVTLNTIEPLLMEAEDATNKRILLEEQQQAEINKIVSKYAKQISDLEEKANDIQEAVKVYATINKDTIFDENKKSRLFGTITIGFRKMPDTIMIEDMEKTIGLIEKKGHPEVVVIKKSIMMVPLKKLGEKFIKSVKATLIEGEEDFYIS